MEKKKKEVSAIGVAYISLGGNVYALYSNFSLNLGNISHDFGDKIFLSL